MDDNDKMIANDLESERFNGEQTCAPEILRRLTLLVKLVIVYRQLMPEACFGNHAQATQTVLYTYLVAGGVVAAYFAAGQAVRHRQKKKL